MLLAPPFSLHPPPHADPHGIVTPPFIDAVLLRRYFAAGAADALVSLWDIRSMLCVRTFPKLE